mgnify:CR=1 FL=1|tara:strand:+ start:302 stop:718 length:417 start_codon:yes stop_codon:yes gene_type:complete
MWSYYANGHDGICIGFDFNTPVFSDLIAANRQIFPNSTDGFLKVDYSRDSRLDFAIEDFKPGSSPIDGLRYFGELAKHKGSHWKHEKEHRLLHWQFEENIQGLTATIDEEYFYFDVGIEAVKEVLVGVNCDEGTVEKI